MRREGAFGWCLPFVRLSQEELVVAGSLLGVVASGFLLLGACGSRHFSFHVFM
jgi:hypothetical protein